ncbi:NAD(P)-binding protein [Hyaloscypha variabilis F]|uniref:NAD(P)-binding protein n=1 Tax=Hyaloscypha variabilis (strain UAMH 11265 / GT02V1 / F) TaxID=1149755 RepID=A0A2J6RJE4_HYAVF|nr:NAD(P)-binding protein [Hyaloscypha variabilis F]
MKSLSKYAHSERPPWALVTGASDGIGLGFVQELSSHGFNIILHGRNQSKLQTTITTLKSQYPSREYRTFIHDAEQELTAEILSNLLTSLQDIHLTILINNVGGAGSVTPAWQTFLARSPQDVDKYINLNLRFPTQLTRALLPQLTENQPSFILNLSSFAALYPAPYISVYAGSKAFNLAWGASLKAEMRAEGIDIDVLGIVIAKSQSAVVKAETSFWVPSAREMARKALGEVGCGRKWVTPVWGHAVQQWVLNCLPEGILERVVIGAAKGEKGRSEKVE